MILSFAIYNGIIYFVTIVYSNNLSIVFDLCKCMKNISKFIASVTCKCYFVSYLQ